MAEAQAWLVLRPSWAGGTKVHGMTIARMTKSRPALDSDELACRVTVKVPDEAFVRPRFDAVLDIPADLLIHPEALEATVEVS